jgi:hypothetical protein
MRIKDHDYSISELKAMVYAGEGRDSPDNRQFMAFSIPDSRDQVLLYKDTVDDMITDAEKGFGKPRFDLSFNELVSHWKSASLAFGLSPKDLEFLRECQNTMNFEPTKFNNYMGKMTVENGSLFIDGVWPGA